MGLEVGFNAALAEVGVVDFVTAASHWGGSIGDSVVIKDLSVAALLVLGEVTSVSTAAVTALDLVLLGGRVLLLGGLLGGFDFLNGFDFLDISGLLGTAWNSASRAWGWAADLVSWVVQGLSVVFAASKSDGWVDIVDGLSAASLAVDIDLGGSAASGLDVGVVVVEGEIVGLVQNLTAWAGLLGDIEDGEVVLWVA